MAISKRALLAWLETLHSDADVAIDDGTLYQCTGDQRGGGARIEIGSEADPDFDRDYVNTVDALQPLPKGRV